MKAERYILIGGLILLVIFVWLSLKDMPIASQEDQVIKGGLTWLTSFDKGTEESIKTGKPVMVYFWAEWCTYCQLLDKETFSDSRVNSILRDNFVLVALDIDRQGDVAARFGVSIPPAMVFLGADGKEITRVPGYVSADILLPVVQQMQNV